MSCAADVRRRGLRPCGPPPWCAAPVRWPGSPPRRPLPGRCPLRPGAKAPAAIPGLQDARKADARNEQGQHDHARREDHGSSRAGNAVPSARVSGRVRTPARVTAPRTPASDMAMHQTPARLPAADRPAAPRGTRSGAGRSRPRRTGAPRGRRRWPAHKPTATRTRCARSRRTVRGACSTIPGNCSPSRTKMTPLAANWTVSQTAVRRTRVTPRACPERSTNPIVTPAATAARMPELWGALGDQVRPEGHQQADQDLSAGCPPRRGSPPSS